MFGWFCLALVISIRKFRKSVSNANYIETRDRTPIWQRVLVMPKHDYKLVLLSLKLMGMVFISVLWCKFPIFQGTWTLFLNNRWEQMRFIIRNLKSVLFLSYHLIFNVILEIKLRYFASNVCVSFSHFKFSAVKLNYWFCRIAFLYRRLEQTEYIFRIVIWYLQCSIILLHNKF
jgi:hypothetical protein